MKVPRFVIGREDCDLVVRDPEVSRRHAVIEAYGRDFVLVDLGSTNGTHVNGALVDSCRLQNGDCIRVGELEAVFRIASRDDEHEDGATGTAPAQRDEGR
ncbi:MAG: FHA domain-containing protein [Candidatus Schekmanbacteria bacterium]|nr:FHA domain-containing protein [Candidatus Schekmanbacteria bacterium]